VYTLRTYFILSQIYQAYLQCQVLTIRRLFKLRRLRQFRRCRYRYSATFLSFTHTGNRICFVWKRTHITSGQLHRVVALC